MASNFLGGLLQQYLGGARPDAATTDQHFDTVSQAVDQGTLAKGITAALNSDQTPPFAQMVSQLFSSGTPEQKAAMLNALAGTGAAGVLSHLSGLLGGGNKISADQAAAVSPDAVQQMANQAQNHDPSIVEKMSAVYAAHPTLVKTLGAAAMIVALRKIAEHVG